MDEAKYSTQGEPPDNPDGFLNLTYFRYFKHHKKRFVAAALETRKWCERSDYSLDFNAIESLYNENLSQVDLGLVLHLTMSLPG